MERERYKRRGIERERKKERQTDREGACVCMGMTKFERRTREDV